MGCGTYWILFSQKGTKFRLAARTMGSASGRPINTTSFPRDCSLRASAVMGFRCPVTGILTKPTFMVAVPPFSSTVPRHLAQATMLGLAHSDETVSCYEQHAWSSFIPGQCRKEATALRELARFFNHSQTADCLESSCKTHSPSAYLLHLTSTSNQR